MAIDTDHLVVTHEVLTINTDQSTCLIGGYYEICNATDPHTNCLEMKTNTATISYSAWLIFDPSGSYKIILATWFVVIYIRSYIQ